VFLFQTNRQSGSHSNLTTEGIGNDGSQQQVRGVNSSTCNPGILLGNSYENISVIGRTNIGSGGITLIGNMLDNGRLLAPDFNAVAPRHGSLPNVGERVQVCKTFPIFPIKSHISKAFFV